MDFLRGWEPTGALFIVTNNTGDFCDGTKLHGDLATDVDSLGQADAVWVESVSSLMELLHPCFSRLDDWEAHEINRPLRELEDLTRSSIFDAIDRLAGTDLDDEADEGRGVALGLPDRGLRLRVPHWVGSGDGLCGSFHRPMETITLTPAEIIYHRRLAVLDHAARSGNITETCRTFGVSRTRFYEWKNRADRYGLDALMPKARRVPQLPNATPTHVIEQLLTLAVLEPTLGARRLADRLADQGWPLAASTAH
jgi:Helix-turn-helix domain